MDKAKDGGPAFPERDLQGNLQQGMTLRDYFAAKVAQGMCAGSWPRRDDLEEIAQRAYLMADAMLKERAK